MNADTLKKCDGSHEDLCVPLEGGKLGESRCTGCGMVFRLCLGCSENAPANIYHAEPLCSSGNTMRLDGAVIAGPPGGLLLGCMNDSIPPQNAPGGKA